MNDRSWMLNPSAIAAARTCIQLVGEELEIKLKLSHPNFLELLQEYAELTDSEKLNASLNELLSHSSSDKSVNKTENAYRAAHKKASRPANMVDSVVTENVDEEAMVEYRGKRYPRINAQGQTFQGLYRGQARYA